LGDCGWLSTWLSASTNVIHVHLIVFFFGFDFFTVININCEIVGLVLKLLTFDLFLFTTYWFGSTSNANFLGGGSDILVFFDLVNVFTIIEIVISV
jgi:hypothetical protein